MDTISLEDLRVFLSVAKANGITRAGAALGIPKAAVSKSLMRLERRLGVQLFERSTRRFAITRAGVALRSRADGLLAEVESLVADLQGDHGDIGGVLTIAAPPELGVWLTKHCFASFLREHPALQLSVRLDYGLHDLFDPEIDLAFRTGHVRDESLVARPLGSFVRVLVARPDLAARPESRSPEGLALLPCLAFNEHDFESTWTLTDGNETRVLEVRGRIGARSYPALMASAAEGLGVAFVPEFIAAPEIERGAVVRLLPRWSSPARTLFVVHRVGRSRVRRVGAFLEHLESHSDFLPPSMVPVAARRGATATRGRASRHG